VLGTITSALFGGSAVRTVVTLLAGIAIGGWTGWQAQGWRQGDLRAKAIEQQARDQLRQIEHRDRASAAYQQEQADADREHIKIVERVRVINAAPAAAGQCLDADGLQQLGAAIDNGAPPAAGPGPALPSAGPAS
jgi:hypothetical protein